jgi:hypothetical protein
MDRIRINPGMDQGRQQRLEVIPGQSGELHVGSDGGGDGQVQFSSRPGEKEKEVTDQYSDTEGQELPGTGGQHVDDRGMVAADLDGEEVRPVREGLAMHSQAMPLGSHIKYARLLLLQRHVGPQGNPSSGPSIQVSDFLVAELSSKPILGGKGGG